MTNKENETLDMLTEIAKQFSWTLGQTIAMEDNIVDNPKDIQNELHILNRQNVKLMKKFGIDIYDELAKQRGYELDD